MTSPDVDPIRLAADRMTKILQRDEEDPSRRPQDVAAALASMAGGPYDAWFDLCLERDTQLAKSRQLYFDPRINFILSHVGTAFREPPHNHWAWNILLIGRGSMHFRWYRRLDDRSEPGKCELELVDDRILGPGDAGIVGAPPHDIHSFEILDDDTWLITVSPDLGATVRQFYDIQGGTYVERAFWARAAADV
jgi:predicted metal-dependent enzyme (double-stranded beta helix superfamily)